MDRKKTVEALVRWLREKVAEAGCDGIVLGLSGGIDSAVLGALGVRAFQEKALGIIMPIDSHPDDEKHAREVAEAIGLPIVKTDLSQTYHTFLQASDLDGSPMAQANVKPRLRMMNLYYWGQTKNLLVAGGSNAAEFFIGYYTKYGDSGVDLLPLGEFLKREIYELGEELGIPQTVLDKKPSAGLWEGQTDEEEFGFSYEELDNFIQGEETGPHREKISAMHRKTAHKRAFPPIFHRKDAGV